MEARPITCRVCGASRSRRVCETHNAHSRTSPLHHRRCNDCGSVFVADDIADSELEQAYKGVNAARYYAEIESESRHKFERARKDLESRGLKSARVIDLGAGNGLFVAMLHEAGFASLAAHEIPGADLSAVDGIATLYRDMDHASIPDASFDVVTLLDVAEHVPDPRKLLRTCARILRPGGLAYIHTPVVTRLDRVMHLLNRLPLAVRVGRAWQKARTSVFHLQNFTPVALQTVAKQADLAWVELEVCNELSWPLSRYVRTYMRLPAPLAIPVSWLLWPLLKTRWWNANKAVLWLGKHL